MRLHANNSRVRALQRAVTASMQCVATDMAAAGRADADDLHTGGAINAPSEADGGEGGGSQG